MKYKPHKKPVTRAFLDIELPEPRISKLAIFLIRILVRPYLFFFIGFAKIILGGEKHLFDAFKNSLSGKSRCIIAFRHPYGHEPQILSWFFLFKLRALAARQKIKFSQRPHALFVYGYEVVRWGGWTARFFMPRVGAMPVHHNKLDSKGMARINKAIYEGPYPVALSPEGQVSYTADSVPHLEPGVIRLGFTAAEKLKKSGEEAELEILPLSVHFRYGRGAEKEIEKLLSRIEKICSLPVQKTLSQTERMKILREHILSVNEKLYEINDEASGSFEERLEAIIEKALLTAERIMGIKNEDTSFKENFFFRIYRLRQVCWDKIYLPGVLSFKGMSVLERNIIDLSAGEAWYAGRHQELIDFCWYFRVPLPTEETELHKKVEYVQNLYDFASRSMGGTISERKNIFPQRIILQSAPPLNLSERLEGFHNDKKAEINLAMEDMEKAFLDCIEDADKIL